MISEELITYPTAQLAKQAGFDVLYPAFYHIEAEKPVLYNYVHTSIMTSTFSDIKEAVKTSSNYYYVAPTQSLLQRWIREVHNIDTEARPIRYTGDEKASYYQEYLQGCTINMKRYAAYELALEQALQEALTIIINRKDAHLS